MHPKLHREPIDREHESSTPEQLADRFAAMALNAVLEPTPDGLDVLTELARRMGKPSG